MREQVVRLCVCLGRGCFYNEMCRNSLQHLLFHFIPGTFDFPGDKNDIATTVFIGSMPPVLSAPRTAPPRRSLALSSILPVRQRRVSSFTQKQRRQRKRRSEVGSSLLLQGLRKETNYLLILEILFTCELTTNMFNKDIYIHFVARPEKRIEDQGLIYYLAKMMQETFDIGVISPFVSQ